MKPVKESLIVFLEGARINLRTFGFLTPMLGVCEDGQPRLEPLIFENQQSKNDLLKRLHSGIAAGKISEFFVLSEAWVAKNDPQAAIAWLREHGSLENFPGRDEQIMLTYCSAQEERIYTCPILRDGEVVDAGEWSENTVDPSPLGIARMAERFHDVFRQAMAGNN